MKETVLGLTKKGKTVCQYEMSCEKMKIVISEYGAAVQTLMVPDANGILRGVVLGYDTLQEYEVGNDKMGAVIGRIVNQVSGASVFLMEKSIHWIKMKEKIAEMEEIVSRFKGSFS